jgi:hypothetical protein
MVSLPASGKGVCNQPPKSGDVCIINGGLTGFRKEYGKDDHECRTHDQEKPKDRSPTQELGQHPSNDGSDGRSKQGPGQRKAHVFTTFGRCGHVGHDSATHGNGGAAAGALKASEHKKSRVTVLQRKADIRENVDGKTD